MLRAYKYRIYPTAEQMLLMEKHFGCTRMIYNKALSAKQIAYSEFKLNLNNGDLSKWLTSMKNDQEKAWLKEINSQSLQAALTNLDTAYKNFFKTGSGFPKFKKKQNKQSFQCPQNVVFEDNKLSLPKFREGIKIELHQKFRGTIKTVTISKTPTGKYFTSILVDTDTSIPETKPVAEETAIGLDLGLKHLLVDSEGNKTDHPKHLKKAEAQLALWQKRLSRKKPGSNRRERTRKKVAKIHEKIANQRKNTLHQISNEITNRYDTICMENLKVKNMVKNRNLAKSISDSGWSMLVEQIRYKSKWKGKNFLQIGTFEKSSKTCSCCDHINEELTLKDREWTCKNCAATHDRDINAANNIKRFALKNWRMERASKDTEVLPLQASTKRRRKRASEVSKVRNSSFEATKL